MSEDCIFCKIVKGEIPCTKLYEDNEVIAFLDIAPVNKGHALVMPKKHFITLIDLPDSLSSSVFSVIKRIAFAQIKTLKAEGFNLLNNNFRTAGQLVPHVHFHVVPRFKEDGLKHWPGKKYGKSEIEEIANELKKNLK